MVLYLAISPEAVFSPIPGTPGILSELSPIRAFKSTRLAGGKLYFSQKACSSKHSVLGEDRLLVVSKTLVLPEMSWRLSRSPVTILHSIPSLSQRRDTVPMTSSASKPSAVTWRTRMAERISFKTGSCAASSSGMPLRVALYCS
ncbi:hypothetical protein SDC9_208520 [bioreactor metagenome]|uniref:Uncharacterized protein n=1 Tax=bioreactor metagenome TaxID=1076179 RepID=A0A645JAV5_9ZZZZ